MAKRFLEVEVSRNIFTTVNIVVDDEDPKYQGMFSGEANRRGFSCLKEAAHKAASEVVGGLDWETEDSSTEIHGYHEVEESLALEFPNWDAIKNEVYEP